MKTRVVKKESLDSLVQFERAVRIHEMKGAYPPEEWDGIEREYEQALDQLMKCLPKTWSQE